MKNNLYTIAIVGSGSCASLLKSYINSYVPCKSIINVATHDKFKVNDQILLSDFIHKDIANLDIIFFCISDSDALNSAITVFTDCGNVAKNLDYFSFRGEFDLNFLKSCVTTDTQNVVSLIKEKKAKTTEDLAKPTLTRLNKSTVEIGLFYYGSGGGFKTHIDPVKETIVSGKSFIEISDEPLTHNINLLPVTSARSLVNIDLAISAHFFPVSHPSIKKLTFMHVLLDFCIFETDVLASLRSSECHYVFCSSKPALESLKKLVLEHNLANEVFLIPGGYPRLDQNITKLNQTARDKTKTKIVVAPTASMREAHDCDLTYLAPFLPQLLLNLAKEFPLTEIELRLHPQDVSDLITKRPCRFRHFLEEACAITKQIPNISLNVGDQGYTQSLQADVVISDTSSFAYTFHFSTGNPVIFLSPGNETIKYHDKLSKLDSIRIRDEIGVSVDNPEAAIEACTSYLAKDAKQWKNSNLADEFLFNRGASIPYLASIMDSIKSGRVHDDWRCQ